MSYAKTDDGMPLYVRTWKEMGRTEYERLVAAPNLKRAKEAFGWTRARFVTITIRRARSEDVDRIPTHGDIERAS